MYQKIRAAGRRTPRRRCPRSRTRCRIVCITPATSTLAPSLFFTLMKQTSIRVIFVTVARAKMCVLIQTAKYSKMLPSSVLVVETKRQLPCDTLTNPQRSCQIMLSHTSAISFSKRPPRLPPLFSPLLLTWDTATALPATHSTTCRHAFRSRPSRKRRTSHP